MESMETVGIIKVATKAGYFGSEKTKFSQVVVFAWMFCVQVCMSFLEPRSFMCPLFGSCAGGIYDVLTPVINRQYSSRVMSFSILLRTCGDKIVSCQRTQPETGISSPCNVAKFLR